MAPRAARSRLRKKTATPTRPRQQKKTATAPTAADLVGTPISIYWAPSKSYHPALVLHFNQQKSLYTVIYFEDETVEELALGKRTGQRNFKLETPPEDDLLGKSITLLPSDSQNGTSWFDFMRADDGDSGTEMTVTVFARITGDIDPEEISSPAHPESDDTPPLYYRIVYLATEFLASVDLTQVDYRINSEEQQVTPISLDNENTPPPAKRSKPQVDNQHDADASRQLAEDESPPVKPVSEDSNHESDNADDSKDYVPLKEDSSSESTREPIVDVMDVDADEEQPVRKLAVRKLAECKAPVRKLAERVTKPVSKSAKDSKAVQADDAPPLPKPSREASTDTQDTQDEPISRARKKDTVTNLFPEVFEDEEVIHDTASDEEKLGWVSKSKDRTRAPQSQVGDYISVDTGSGDRRNGFVEAYLPQTDTHFVAFCDEEGGNMQIKLTSSNHSSVKEDEVASLKRKRAANSNGDAKNGTSSNGLAKRGRISSDNTGKGKRDRKPTPRGKPAGAELCGRCISLEWPGTDEEFVALVMAYSADNKKHNIVYFADNCIETVDLRVRAWNLIPKGGEPWAADGMLGKRVYVFWNGEYDDPASQALSTKIFGEDTKVPYEAYVLHYVGFGKYKILYPASEDFEVRELKAEGPEDVEACEKEWDILEDGVDNVSGLPILSWTG